jgi:hypothetical protein
MLRVVIAGKFNILSLLPLIFSGSNSVEVMCNNVQLVEVELWHPV